MKLFLICARWNAASINKLGAHQMKCFLVESKMTGNTIQQNAASAMKAVVLSSALGLCFAAPMHAQAANSTTGEFSNEYARDNRGGAQRINAAGKTRMLSQRISGIACVLMYSNDIETMAPRLTAAINNYGEIIQALRVGNPDMKIFGAEEKRRILQSLDALSTLWAPFRVAAENVAAGENVEESMAFIAENNMALLELAKKLVTEVSAEYANPIEITVSEALLIDFSGRQRMLTQKISKESCGIVTGNSAFGQIDDLSKTIATYEATLLALHDGMPAVGIAPPPTKQIMENLVEALAQWQEIKAALSEITGKGSIDGDATKHLSNLLDAKLKKMHVITGLYAEYAKAHE